MYGKIFEQIYDGTLVENWKALITFQQMIILCDDCGILDMTPNAIANRTGIPNEIIKEGIERLEDDDPYSRTPDENGKRIIRLDNHRPWGWKIINHKKYKSMGNYEDKKRADRERMAEKRKEINVAMCSDVSQVVENCSIESDQVADVAHTNTNTNTKENIVINDHCELGSSPNVPHKEIVDLYHAMLPELPSVRSWTKKRAALLRARWKSRYKNIQNRTSDTIEFWVGFFEYIRESDFLMGKAPASNRPFVCTLEWMLIESNFIKIFEGKYHR